jgi:hypothetical protein
MISPLSVPDVSTQSTPAPALDFSVSPGPAMNRDAATTWFWLMVRRYRAWSMSLSLVLAVALSALGFWLDQPALGLGFAVVALLVVLYFPLFHFGFRYAAAKTATAMPVIPISIAAPLMTVTLGKHRVVVNLDDGVEVVERPDYLLLWYSRYGWLCLPKDQLPDQALALLRSLPGHSSAARFGADRVRER